MLNGTNNIKLNNLKIIMIDITIIMTVRNSQNYISQAIESVLIQSYKKFEFIIIDDFSNDATNKIIKDYKKRIIELNLLEIQKKLAQQFLEIRR